MNRLVIIGNVCTDPELRTTPSGVDVCTFVVAVNGRYKDKDGNTRTDFFRVTAWRQLGTVCSKYLSKGKKAAVVGEVSAKAYTDKNGVVRASMELNAQDVEFLTPKDEPRQPVDTSMKSYAEEQLDHAKRTAEDATWTEISDSDLPF